MIDAGLKTVEIYTDGACSGNPGKGGWGAVLLFNGRSKELSGNNPHTTNNQMELTAVIEGVKAVKERCNIVIYSDSAYIVNAVNLDWLDNWFRNNWVTSSGTVVANRELWEELIKLFQQQNLVFKKVKGHSTNDYNNRADYLATSAIKRLSGETT